MLVFPYRSAGVAQQDEVTPRDIEPPPSLSVIVQRSRGTGPGRATVRVGSVKAGYRDLQTGEVHCADVRYFEIVTDATAPIAISTSRRDLPRTSLVADLYRGPCPQRPTDPCP